MIEQVVEALVLSAVYACAAIAVWSIIMFFVEAIKAFVLKRRLREMEELRRRVFGK